MTAGEDRLVRLAAALADGLPIDWDAEESSASSNAERARIRELRAVHSLASPAAGSTDTASGPSPPAEEPADPETWGPLRVRSRIGRGHFGVVYRAHDPRLERDVALKLLRYRDARTDIGATAAVDEGRLLAKVHHPNVVTVFGAERVGNQVGIWMELLKGRTLEEEFHTSGAFTAARVVAVGEALSRALSAVHQAGLLHRDVKAQNVMRTPEGRIVLMDFGTGREMTLAAPDELAGTPLYLAPEVLEGAKATAASDLYSLSVLLFRLATGHFPVDGRSLAAIRSAQAALTTDELRRRLSSLPAGLAAVIARGLARRPERRFSSAEEMGRALEALGRPSRAKQTIVGAAVVLMLIFVGAWFGYSRGWFARGTGLEYETIWSGEGVPTNASVSADGSVIAFVTRDTRDIALYDVKNRRVLTRLTTRAQDAADQPFHVAISGDGASIAYTWWNAARDVTEVRLIAAVAGAQPRTVVAGPPTGAIGLIRWAPDGQQIACAMSDPDQLAILNVRDGTYRKLATIDWRGPASMVWSPDGRFIAYDDPASADESQRDIFVAEVATGRVERVVQGPDRDLVAGWSPAGDRLVFVSDRRGSPALWRQSVRDGMPDGPPEHVRSIDRFEPLAVVSSGDVMGLFTARDRTMQVASVDLATGRLLKEPEALVLDSYVSFRQAGWSYDGTQIAYMSVNPRARTDLTLIVHGPANVTRELPLGLVSLATFEWSTDGRSFVGRGIDTRNRLGLFQIDAATGRIALMKAFSENPPTFYFTPHWSGRYIYYTRGNGQGFIHGELIRRDPVTGDEEVVLALKDARTEPGVVFPGMRDLRTSPDAKYVAGLDPGFDRKPPDSTLWIIDIERKAAREVLRVKAPRAFTHNAGVQWSPDSRALIVNRIGPSPGAPREIWYVPIDGRQPHRLDVGPLRIVDAAIAVHPTEPRIAFSAGDPPAFEIRRVRGLSR